MPAEQFETIEVEGVRIQVREGFGDIEGDKAYRLEGSWTWIFTDKDLTHERVISGLVDRVKNPAPTSGVRTIRLI